MNDDYFAYLEELRKCKDCSFARSLDIGIDYCPTHTAAMPEFIKSVPPKKI